ncbi:pyruvate ferredoxin oxidoreductase subunit alpha [Fibrobacterales bacterium]|nr:pyruvate ferredoxin oxidoreductase subunit alpha [Fibrobacterales bacterium]
MAIQKFLSGNEAIAEAVKLAKPAVIAVYPITPQTTVVEKLADFVANGELKTEFINVESEHSALSALMGASAMGVRTFTATSSQGLLYMSECLHYAAGGRFPIVMMNANRAVALPWNIFGDQRDSLSQLESGWIQLYAENAQEAFDLTLSSFAIAENHAVALPVMLNVDGFALTHTYEPLNIISQEDADKILPPFKPFFEMNLEKPLSLGFSAGPRDNTAFKQHQINGMKAAAKLINEKFGDLVDAYKLENAKYAIITLGSISGLVRDVIDELQSDGVKVGLLRLRSLRPFPEEELRSALANFKTVGVLEKNLSVGAENAVAKEIKSALYGLENAPQVLAFSGGLGGRDISANEIKDIISKIIGGEK